LLGQRRAPGISQGGPLRRRLNDMVGELTSSLRNELRWKSSLSGAPEISAGQRSSRGRGQKSPRRPAAGAGGAPCTGAGPIARHRPLLGVAAGVPAIQSRSGAAVSGRGRRRSPTRPTTRRASAGSSRSCLDGRHARRWPPSSRSADLPLTGSNCAPSAVHLAVATHAHA
jgi:hypothetical protein